MSAIYNEIEPYAAQWLRNLIAAGHIANGVVDERSISDLVPADVAGPGQRHFFSGIGVWSHALRLAEVSDDADVWTGSCPCQPFSSAGRGGGFDDERHLWPVWFRLISECRPAIVFGEQVASPAGLEWLDAVFADLEGAGYACAAADLCAASVGAPHIRQRIYFVAYSQEIGCGSRRASGEIDRPRKSRGPRPTRKLGDTCGSGGRRDTRAIPGTQSSSEGEWSGSRRVSDQPIDAGAARGFWSSADWIPCRDDKARPVEPGTFPLVNGATARVGRLRAYGNAIVPQVAAAFICAALEAAP